ncbi:MAG: formate--tetrahydrofolate ligase [Verrucomicrobiota bacterium]
MRSIQDVAGDLGWGSSDLEPFGHDRAKVSLEAIQGKSAKGKLILVSAITPTPAGEGKTTTAISLAQGMKAQGHSVALALREPSMGPVFGRKGGATGGGKASLSPSDSINLLFNGDFPAITAAHNLIAAAMDNALHFRQTTLDPARVLWKRVMDMNDRALRSITVGLQGQGVARESGFDITAASEVMAILCLAEGMEDLRERLDRILLGFRSDWSPVFAEELGITGALAAILRDALKPNLVQSLEGVPALVHGGPFANIAHGCNSVLATRAALSGADYAVTEAGFAFDLGGEKFFHIKCRGAGLDPAAVVLVATVRALKMHGGQTLDRLSEPSPPSVEKGLENLAAHLDAAAKFGKPLLVAINRFPNDTAEEVQVIQEFCAGRGVRCGESFGFGEGGPGAADLADLVVEVAEEESPAWTPLYAEDADPRRKIESIAKQVYGADGVSFTSKAERKLRRIAKLGLEGLPICMAKTQNSLSDDGAQLGRPSGFSITVRDLEIARGAGFLVALTGDLLRMPALPKVPAAKGVEVDEYGEITGLMSG